MSSMESSEEKHREEKSGGALLRIGAFLAFAAPLLLGAYTYYMGAQKDAEVAALGMLRTHSELASNNPELASEIPANKAQRLTREGLFTPDYARFGTHALFTAESIYTLVGGEPSWLKRMLIPGIEERVRSWNATTIELARLHDTFVMSADFRCKEYDQRFIEFLKKKSERFESICPARNDTDTVAINKLEKAANAQEEFKKATGFYTDEIAHLAKRDFRQGDPSPENPPVEIDPDAIIRDKERTAYDESYYCMQSPSGKDQYDGAYKFFRITPYNDTPIPGSC